MTITLNGYLINDASTGVWLDVQIDGLSLPLIRTSSGNYSGRDGGYVGSQFYGARDIALQGTVNATNISALETTRKAFQTALTGQTVTMGIVTNAGASYVIYANLVDFQMPIPRGLFVAPFKIELLAADPTIYDNAGGGALTANVSRIVSGGYTYPVTYPVTYAGATGPTTVTNAGTSAVYPTVTMTGTMTNPVLTNNTTGAFLSLTPLTTGPGDTVTIDMRQRQVLLNGGSIYGLVSGLSTFWSLQPGGNSISLTTSSGADTVTAVVSWRSGYMGI